MDTRKLYYEDAYIRRFEGRVLSCGKDGDGWRVTLDRTAFFPEGGGQTADTGTLGPARVLDAHEAGGVIRHKTDAPLPVGESVTGTLDWDARFHKMQNHTGEHVLSGLIHARYGYSNVGFHLGDDGSVIDFDGELTRPQLDELEADANAVVWDNRPVTARFPAPAELETMEYRSKLDLRENVRIVTVEGVDVCACCAPHVARTGEIGAIKILDAMRHRGGVRLWLKCGAAALRDYRARYAADAEVSGLLNVPQADIADGTRRLLAQRDGLKHELAAVQRQAAEDRAASLVPVSGDMLLFFQGDQAALQLLANAGADKCGGVCAVFSGQDGDWRFVMASRGTDVRAFLKEHGAALRCRGGGQAGMVSGHAAAARAELEAFFAGR